MFNNDKELTSVDPLNLALKAKTTTSRVVWWLITIVDLFIMICLMIWLIMKFQANETNATIEIKRNQGPFPAVTFCNKNPYKRSALQKIPELAALVDRYTNVSRTGNKVSLKTNEASDRPVDASSGKRRKRQACTASSCSTCCTNKSIVGPVTIGQSAFTRLTTVQQPTWECAFTCCKNNAPSGITGLFSTSRLARIDTQAIVASLSGAGILSSNNAFCGLSTVSSGVYQWYDTASSPITGGNQIKVQKDIQNLCTQCDTSTGGNSCFNSDHVQFLISINSGQTKFDCKGTSVQEMICEYILIPTTTSTTTTTTTTTTVTTTTTTKPSTTLTTTRTSQPTTITTRTTPSLTSSSTLTLPTTSTITASTKQNLVLTTISTASAVAISSTRSPLLTSLTTVSSPLSIATSSDKLSSTAIGTSVNAQTSATTAGCTGGACAFPISSTKAAATSVTAAPAASGTSQSIVGNTIGSTASSAKASTDTPSGGFQCGSSDGNYADPTAANGCSTFYYSCSSGVTKRVNCTIGLFYDSTDSSCKIIPACVSSSSTRLTSPSTPTLEVKSTTVRTFVLSVDTTALTLSSTAKNLATTGPSLLSTATVSATPASIGPSIASSANTLTNSQVTNTVSLQPGVTAPISTPPSSLSAALAKSASNSATITVNPAMQSSFASANTTLGTNTALSVAVDSRTITNIALTATETNALPLTSNVVSASQTLSEKVGNASPLTATQLISSFETQSVERTSTPPVSVSSELPPVVTGTGFYTKPPQVTSIDKSVSITEPSITSPSANSASAPSATAASASAANSVSAPSATAISASAATTDSATAAVATAKTLDITTAGVSNAVSGDATITSDLAPTVNPMQSSTGNAIVSVSASIGFSKPAAITEASQAPTSAIQITIAASQDTISFSGTSAFLSIATVSDTSKTEAAIDVIVSQTQSSIVINPSATGSLAENTFISNSKESAIGTSAFVPVISSAMTEANSVTSSDLPSTVLQSVGTLITATKQTKAPVTFLSTISKDDYKPSTVSQDDSDSDDNQDSSDSDENIQNSSQGPDSSDKSSQGQNSQSQSLFPNAKTAETSPMPKIDPTPSIVSGSSETAPAIEISFTSKAVSAAESENTLSPLLSSDPKTAPTIDSAIANSASQSSLSQLTSSDALTSVDAFITDSLFSSSVSATESVLSAETANPATALSLSSSAMAAPTKAASEVSVDNQNAAIVSSASSAEFVTEFGTNIASSDNSKIDHLTGTVDGIADFLSSSTAFRRRRTPATNTFRRRKTPTTTLTMPESSHDLSSEASEMATTKLLERSSDTSTSSLHLFSKATAIAATTGAVVVTVPEATNSEAIEPTLSTMPTTAILPLSLASTTVNSALDVSSSDTANLSIATEKTVDVTTGDISTKLAESATTNDEAQGSANKGKSKSTMKSDSFTTTSASALLASGTIAETIQSSAVTESIMVDTTLRLPLYDPTLIPSSATASQSNQSSSLPTNNELSVLSLSLAAVDETTADVESKKTNALESSSAYALLSEPYSEVTMSDSAAIMSSSPKLEEGENSKTPLSSAISKEARDQASDSILEMSSTTLENEVTSSFQKTSPDLDLSFADTLAPEIDINFPVVDQSSIMTQSPSTVALTKISTSLDQSGTSPSIVSFSDSSLESSIGEAITAALFAAPLLISTLDSKITTDIPIVDTTALIETPVLDSTFSAVSQIMDSTLPIEPVTPTLDSAMTATNSDADFSIVPAVTLDLTQFPIINSQAETELPLQPPPPPPKINPVLANAITHLFDDVQNYSLAETATAADALAYVMATMSLETQKKAGYNISEVLMRCIYNGVRCGLSDFELKIDPNFGNCYVFNADGNHLVGFRAGAMTGLSVTYNVGQNEYLDFSQAAGVRIVVHEQNETVFPDVMGIDVPGGYESSAALTKVATRGISIPSKPCAKSPSCVIDYNYKETIYATEACIRSCYQSHVIAKCQCGDPRIPMPQWALESNVSHCDLRNRDCVNDNYNITAYRCECPRACRVVDFEITQTTSKWPTFYVEHIQYVNLEGSVNVSNNNDLARIDVFYENMIFFQYVEDQTYTWQDLMWDLSSIIGLFLGISVISLFEVIQLGMWCRKKCRK